MPFFHRSAYPIPTGLLMLALTRSPSRTATSSLLAPKEARNRILSCALTQVYHSMGNYKQALQCYLDSQDHPMAAFRCCSVHVLLFHGHVWLVSRKISGSADLNCMSIPSAAPACKLRRIDLSPQDLRQMSADYNLQC